LAIRAAVVASSSTDRAATRTPASVRVPPARWKARSCAFVAHHDTFAELETEHITRIDPGVDAAEHLQGVAARKGKAGERPRRGEHRVAPNQLIGRDDHV
jgi:hypothetical protein